jgi:hypothetical protein
MELSKEWQKEADKILSTIKYDDQTLTDGVYIDKTVIDFGLKVATAYKQAVEKELNRRIELRQKAHSKFIRSASKTANSTAIKTLKRVLKSLETLTPTSND